MAETVYPPATAEIGRRRKELAPEIHQAFQIFSRVVFSSGALPEKTKQLIAVAVAHVTQCAYCIAGHTRLARRKGATDEEVMEAIWVAARCAPAVPMPIRRWRCRLSLTVTTTEPSSRHPRSSPNWPMQRHGLAKYELDDGPAF